MRHFLLLTLIAIGINFTFTGLSLAVCGGGPTAFFCNDSPPNPDPNGIQQAGNMANLSVVVSDGAGIDIAGNQACIDTGPGNDSIEVTGATLECGNDGINFGPGVNTVNIVDSVIRARTDVLDSVGATNTVNIQGSSLLCNSEFSCNGINGSGSVDIITIVDSFIDGELDPSIELSGGNDILRLGTGADIARLIRCGFGQDNDTLIFNMEVPEEQLNQLSLEISTLGPDDSITINGLSYEWEDCENIVNELVGVKAIRPIPTLSEWGLIAMAGLIGITGILFYRKRAVKA